MIDMRRSLLCFSALLAFAAFAQKAPAQEPSAQDGAPAVTVFEGATIIVGDESPPIENGVFVVRGTRFDAVGGAGEVEVPEDAARVDLTGMTVMPAIVDTHTHLSLEREALLEDLRQRARFGVGTALSLGHDNSEVPFAVRGESELVPGVARYRTAGRGITSPEPGRSDAPYWVTTEREARDAVAELAGQSVDIVKIWVDDRNGQYERLSPELYTAIIDEAHRRGLRVTAHIFRLEDAKGLLRAGIDAFAHGIRDTDVDDEVVALFKERPHVVLVPNLPARGGAPDLTGLEEQIPAEARPSQPSGANDPAAQAAFDVQARNLARLAAEGVRIALGTDGNTPWGPHLEMADMVAAGMTPRDVIVAATRNSADFLHVNAGTIAEGKSADFIVLEANPLEDIRNTRRIADVYLRGERVHR